MFHLFTYGDCFLSLVTVATLTSLAPTSIPFAIIEGQLAASSQEYPGKFHYDSIINTLQWNNACMKPLFFTLIYQCDYDRSMSSCKNQGCIKLKMTYCVQETYLHKLWGSKTTGIKSKLRNCCVLSKMDKDY